MKIGKYKYVYVYIYILRLYCRQPFEMRRRLLMAEHRPSAYLIVQCSGMKIVSKSMGPVLPIIAWLSCVSGDLCSSNVSNKNEGGS